MSSSGPPSSPSSTASAAAIAAAALVASPPSTASSPSSTSSTAGGAGSSPTTWKTIGMKRKERDGGAATAVIDDVKFFIDHPHQPLSSPLVASSSSSSSLSASMGSGISLPASSAVCSAITAPSSVGQQQADDGRSPMTTTGSSTMSRAASPAPSSGSEEILDGEGMLLDPPSHPEAESLAATLRSEEKTALEQQQSHPPPIRSEATLPSPPSSVLSGHQAGSVSTMITAVKKMEDESHAVRSPEEELLNLRTIVGTITQGIGQLQNTLQRSQTQWHFHRIVGQLTELSQELSGQLEQTYALYSLLQSHNLMDEIGRKGTSYSGFFSVLPEECILHALSFLPERDLATVARLNRQFKRLAEDDAIWRLLALRRWKKARERGREKASKRRRHGWREYFIGRRHIDKNWDSGTYALRTIAGHDNQLYCIQFDEDKIISGSEDETMKVWDIATGKCMKTLRGHTSGVWCLQFWHDRLLSGSEDSTIKIWDLETGNCRHTLNGHKYGVWSLQFDDRILVSGAEDQTIKMWDMHTLQCTNTLLGHKSDIWSLQFDAAQHLIVSGSGYEDRTLKMWDMRTCTCVMTLTGHMGAVNSLCVFYGSQSHPHRILSGSADQTIKVWDRRSGLCETTLEGHQGEVLCLKMADSRNPRIVSGGGSTCKTIKVWEDWYNSSYTALKRKDHVSLSLAGHENGVWGLQYDEDKIISGSADKTIKLWDFSVTEEELQRGEHQEHVEIEELTEDTPSEAPEPSADGGMAERVVVRGKRKRDDDDF